MFLLLLSISHRLKDPWQREKSYEPDDKLFCSLYFTALGYFLNSQHIIEYPFDGF